MAIPDLSRMCALAGVHLFEPKLDGEVAHWLEARPNEDGRQVLMRADPWSDPADLAISALSICVSSRREPFRHGMRTPAAPR